MDLVPTCKLCVEKAQYVSVLKPQHDLFSAGGVCLHAEDVTSFSRILGHFVFKVTIWGWEASIQSDAVSEF